MPANSIAQAVLFCCLLIAAAVADVRQREIPGALPLGIFAAALLTYSDIKLLGLLPAVALTIAVAKKGKVIGAGDIKLIAASGLVLGFINITAGLAIALLLWIVCIRIDGKSQAAYPLAPFLSAGLIAAYIIDFGGLLI